jgi:hypothetical protein
VKTGGCDPRTSNPREASLRRAFQTLFYTCVKISRAASLVFVFVAGYSTGGTSITGIFFRVGKEGTGGSGWAAGVGPGAGHPQSTTMTWRSLTVDKPCESRVSCGGEARSYACGRRVAAGEAAQFGGGGHQD